MRAVAELLDGMPTDRLQMYVSVFEAGRVQAWPQARFVNEAGECCIVGALAGARTSAEFASLPLYAGFRGGVLEELSRRFEARSLTGQDFYEECLLVLAARAAQPAAAVTESILGRNAATSCHDAPASLLLKS
jgi:hypothetical protein